MIRLIFRSHSIHELLLHRVCEQARLYTRAGVDVVLQDGSGPKWAAASADDAAATVAVGGVVAAWLRGDSRWEIPLVATDRPLIWVVGDGPVASVADLLGRRIATPRRSDMPSIFLRLLLARHGYDSDRDVELVEVDHRPDRQRLLQSGNVDAALVGPEGLRPTGAGAVGGLYVGDHIRFPTVGLAVRPGANSDEVDALTAAFGDGLVRLREDEAAGLAAMRALDPQVDDTVAGRVLRGFIRPHWHGAARVTDEDFGDVPAVAATLGVSRPSTHALRKLLQGTADRKSPRT